MENKDALTEKIKKIEEIAKSLEKGDLSLEDSISEYEKALNLIQECNKDLEEAKNKIFKLTPDNIQIEVDEDLQEVNE